MKKLLFIFCLVLIHLQGINIKDVPNINLPINDIETLISDYINLTQRTVKQQSLDFMWKGDDFFVNFTNKSRHINNAKPFPLDTTFVFPKTFFIQAKNDSSNNLSFIDYDFESLKIHPCKKFEKIENKTYAYATIKKQISFKDGTKKNHVDLFKINMTASPIKIHEIFPNISEFRDIYLPNCNTNTGSDETALQQQLLLSNKEVETGAQLLKQKKYTEARIHFNKALEYNKDNALAKQGIDTCDSFISLALLKQNIATAIQDANYDLAQEILTTIEVKKLCYDTYCEVKKDEIISLKRLFILSQEFDKAEALFANRQFNKAKVIYERLETSDYKNPLISQRLNEILNSNTKSIEDEIKQAYDIAVQSKGKRADETFKTYYKYENSGYLNGDNFKFMCQKMLSRGNKSLLKEMNISPNQAKNLAISYFYKAKNLGENMNQIEMTVFTSKFNKKRKN